MLYKRLGSRSRVSPICGRIFEPRCAPTFVAEPGPDFLQAKSGASSLQFGLQSRTRTHPTLSFAYADMALFSPPSPFFFYVWLGLAAWRPRSKAGSPPSQAPPSYFSLSPLRPSSGFRPPAAPVAARYGPFSPTAPHTCPHQLCTALRASPSRFALLAAAPLPAPGVPVAVHFAADLVLRRDSIPGSRA